MPEVTPAISIVNLEHPDPAGSPYFPPTIEHPYWRNPDRERVAVSQVWAGTDPDTKKWIFDTTFDFYCQAYRDAFISAESAGLIFRTNGLSYLLSELQSQLGEGHWLVK